jgi:hypothetical protein
MSAIVPVRVFIYLYEGSVRRWNEFILGTFSRCFSHRKVLHVFL